jgi:hypothetical protein
MSLMFLASGEAGATGASPPLPASAVPVSTRASVTLRTKTDRRTGGGILRGVAETTRVELPAGVGESFEVFVNGVVQQPGRDFRREGGELVFEQRLAREGRLGFWRWLSLFLGVAGTYRQNDSVDVVYERDGRRVVATSLPLARED